jgi:Thioesterase domains of type I polyketide synthases or non-ribosomal peptide synthetases
VENDDTGLADLLIRVRDQTIRASEAYVPAPYGGKLTLFTAQIGMVEPYQDRYLGWGPLVKSIEVHRIPGSHTTMIDRAELGDVLDAHLRRAQDRMNEASMAESMRPVAR